MDWADYEAFCLILRMGRKLLKLIIAASIGINVQAQVVPKWKIDDVVNYFNKNNDTVFVVNFWATFCKPCVAEIPDFIRLSKKYRNQKVKLLLVSLDLPEYYPAKIRAFANKHKYNTNIVWLNETDADIFCPRIDKKWSGAIPATIIVNGSTGYRKFIEDEIKADYFEAILKEAITKTKLSGMAKDHSFDPVNEPQ